MRIILGAALGVYFTMAAYGDINPVAHFNSAADGVTVGITSVMGVINSCQ